MIYGVITHTGSTTGTIITHGGTKFKFSMSECPGDLGDEVIFEKDLEASSISVYFAHNIILQPKVANAVVADLLARVGALEQMIAKTTSNEVLTRILTEDRDYGDAG